MPCSTKHSKMQDVVKSLMDNVQWRTLILVCSQYRLVQTESQDFISKTWLLRTIWTAKSKPFWLGNQRSGHPSAFCTTLSPGVTVISPLSKNMTGHKGHKRLDRHLRSAFLTPSPHYGILLYSKLWPSDLVSHPSAGHVVMWCMSDGAEVRHTRAGEDPIHKSSGNSVMLFGRNCVLDCYTLYQSSPLPDIIFLIAQKKAQTVHWNTFFMQAAILSMQGFPKLPSLNQIFRKTRKENGRVFSISSCSPAAGGRLRYSSQSGSQWDNASTSNKHEFLHVLIIR